MKKLLKIFQDDAGEYQIKKVMGTIIVVWGLVILTMNPDADNAFNAIIVGVSSLGWNGVVTAISAFKNPRDSQQTP